MSGDKDKAAILSRLQKAASALKEMRVELEAEKASKREPVAIIGMSCRLPGADNPASYWSLLSNGLDGTGEVPEDRWNLEEYYDPDPDAPGKIYCRRGGFLRDIKGMDTAFFGISPKEARSLDPQQRLLLEVSWEAIENAGISADSLRDSSSGVFVGICSQDYGQHSVFSGISERIDPYCLTGMAFSAAAGRISYTLGLRGPAMSVDTACSSSLVSIHLAANSLRNGESDLALAGGVNVMTVPETTVYFCKLKALSPEGRCKTFDAGANGYARGEGCGMIVLKRLGDALRDKDNILAVIKGSATNNDGRSGGFTVPNGPSQVAVLKKALLEAGLKPGQVDYIEAHGTGTALGDPIEIGALAEVYKKSRSAANPLIIGSAKTNIGHLEGGAGVAGVVKVVLSLNNRIIPPHINFSTLNPDISRDGFDFHIPVEPMPWTKENGKRVAGVSSFGISGSNAHLIIEEAPETNVEEFPGGNETQILTLSAKSDQALDDMIGSYGELCKSSSSKLSAIAYSANTGRNQMKDRLAVLLKDSNDIDELFDRIKSGVPSREVFRGKKDFGKNRSIVFLFTGQGSQYFKMGLGLYNSQKVFRDAMNRCDEIYRAHNDHSLLDIIFSGQDPGLVDRTLHTQPSLFALQHSLAELWKSWGVRPDIVIGHSVGEIAASATAGVFSAEEGLLFAMKRARIMRGVSAGGSMAAVFADLQTVQEAISDYADTVSVATINAEQSIVVSGDEKAVAEIVENLKARNIKSQFLTVSHAFHSPLMDPVLNDIRNIALDINFQPPRLRLIANLTAKTLGSDEMSADYWAEHARNPVRFYESVKTAEEYGGDVFLEIGPAPVLMSLAKQTLTSEDKVWIPSLTRGRDDNEQILAALSQAFVSGIDINWNNFYRRKKYRRAELPGYPFQRELRWLEPTSGGRRLPDQSYLSEGSEKQPHSLLGSRLSTSGSEIIFSNKIGSDSPKFLGGHKVYKKTVFPGAGYWEMALSACSVVFETKRPAVSDVFLAEPLIIEDKEEVILQLALREPKDGKADFIISSRIVGRDENEPWRRHASGAVALGDADRPDKDLVDLKARCKRELDSKLLMSRLRASGLEYGSAFQTVEGLFSDDDGSVIAAIGLYPGLASDASGHVFHPTMLDGCLQAMAATMENASADSPYLPIAVDKVSVFAPIPNLIWTRSEIEAALEEDPDSVKGNIDVYDANGNILASIVGFHARRASRKALMRAMAADREDLFYKAEWIKKDAPEKIDSPSGNLVVFSDKSGHGARLKELLEENQCRCAVVESGPGYSKTGDFRYQVNPESGSDFKKLFRDLIENDKLEISGYVYLWGLDAGRADNISAKTLTDEQNRVCGGLLSLLQSLQLLRLEQTRLWIATQGAQNVESTCVYSPVQSLLWGFGRVANIEIIPLQAKLIDLDFIPVDKAAESLRKELGISDGEDQISWRSDNRFTCRLAKTDSPGLPAEKSGGDKGPCQLRIQNKGILDSLEMVGIKAGHPASNEVKIDIRATGLNFKDVMNALDMYPGDAGSLGGECAGVIVEAGDEVSRFKPGDSVVAMGPACFSSETTVSEELVVPMPPKMSFEQAVSIPIAFSTAYYSLNTLAGLRAKDRVLIHTASGGVGLAAIQLSQDSGAEIFSTAGNERKRRYLSSLGLSNIMSSRDYDFAEAILDKTRNMGVRVILNTLTDEFIAKSFSVLQEKGEFIEIGKVDVWSDERLEQLGKEVFYHTVALDQMAQEQPKKINEIMSQIFKMIEEGRLSPLPATIYGMDKVIDAFRYMQKAEHIGKIVVSQYGKGRNPVKPNASYLIVGGTGGLGLGIAGLLADMGARNLILTARRQPSEEAARQIAGMEKKGVRAEVILSDISDELQTMELLNKIDERFPPLLGIIHAAGTLDDNMIEEQTMENLQKVLSPKVAGAWNLHKLSLNFRLDFFVMFSSVAAMFGGPSQSAYAAANSYLDSLAAYRNRLGLPGLSVNWGPWSDVGMAADLGEIRKSWEEMGMGSISPDEGLEILSGILSVSHGNFLVFKADWDLFFKNAPEHMTPTVFGNFKKGRVDSGEGSEKIRALNPDEILAEYRATPINGRHRYISGLIKKHASRILGLASPDSIDSNVSLYDIGLDSLMAVELRNILESALGATFSTTLLFDYPTSAKLAEYLINEVIELKEEPAEVKSEDDSAKASRDNEIENLKDDELEEALLKELEDSGF